MKLLRIELLIVSLVLLFMLVSQVRIYFGWYNYTEIKATLTDKDYMGAPYVVKEVNFQNRCFEDGKIVRKPLIWEADKILDDYPFFHTTFSFDGIKYTSEGKLIELCIEISKENIDTIHAGLFSNEMILDYEVDVKWSPMSYGTFSETDDYFIKYNSKFSTAGLGSAEYKRQKIREFVLRRSLDAIEEYGKYNNQTLKELYPHLIASSSSDQSKD